MSESHEIRFTESDPVSHQLLKVLFDGWKGLDKGTRAAPLLRLYANHLGEQIKGLSEPPTGRLVAACLSSMGPFEALGSLPDPAGTIKDILTSFNQRAPLWSIPDSVMIWQLAARASSRSWRNPLLLRGLLELEGAPSVGRISTRTVSLAPDNKPARSPYESLNRTLLGWASEQPSDMPGAEGTGCLEYLLEIGVDPSARATKKGASALALASAPQAKLLLDAGLDLFPGQTHRPFPFTQWIDPIRLARDPHGVSGLLEELALKYAKLASEEKERFSISLARRLARVLSPEESWSDIPQVSKALEPLGEVGMDLEAWRIEWAKILLLSQHAPAPRKTWSQIGSREDVLFARRDGTARLPRNPWTNALSFALEVEPSQRFQVSNKEVLEVFSLLPDLPPAWPRMAVLAGTRGKVDSALWKKALLDAELAVLEARTDPGHPFHQEASSILDRKSKTIGSMIARRASIVASAPNRLGDFLEEEREELRTHLAFMAGGHRTIDRALDWMLRWARANGSGEPSKGPLGMVVTQAFASPVVADLLAQVPARLTLWESLQMDMRIPAPSVSRPPGRSRF